MGNKNSLQGSTEHAQSSTAQRVQGKALEVACQLLLSLGTTESSERS